MLVIWSVHWSSKTLFICLFLKRFLSPWILILYPQFLISQGPPVAPTKLLRSHKFRHPLGRVGWGSCSSGLILPFSQLTQHSICPSPCSPYPSIKTHLFPYHPKPHSTAHGIQLPPACLPGKPNTTVTQTRHLPGRWPSARVCAKENNYFLMQGLGWRGQSSMAG